MKLLDTFTSSTFTPDDFDPDEGYEDAYRKRCEWEVLSGFLNSFRDHLLDGETVALKFHKIEYRTTFFGQLGTQEVFTLSVFDPEND